MLTPGGKPAENFP